MSNALPIEVSVWNGASPTQMLAILDSASSARWSDLLGDVGAGSCELSVYDPKATASNTLKGNLIKFSLGGTPVFAFFNEAPALTVGEAADSKWVFSGKQVLDYLKWAVVYPPGGLGAPTGSTRTWTAATPGTVVKTLIDEAIARGTIPSVTYDFTATLDSAGNAWTANLNLTVDVGSTVLDVVKKLAALGIGIYMDPSLVLHLYIPGAQGATLTSAVIWRYGAHITAPVPNVGSMPTTVALVKGVGGTFVEASDATMTGNPYIGRRESGLDYSSVSGDSTQMTLAGNQQIALSVTSSQAITVSLNHGAGGLYEPYVDYRPGDTIALDIPGSYSSSPFKIVGLTIAQTANANYTIDANLGSIALDLDLMLKQLVGSVSGSSSSLGGGAAGNLTLTNPKGFPMGAAFPLNPTTGMAWFLTGTGKNEWCYYSGGRWLGKLETATWDRPRGTDINPIAANVSWDGLFPDPTRSIYMETLYGRFYVLTTNDGTKYWTFTDGVTGAVISTISNAPNTWVPESVAVNAVVAPVTMAMVAAKASTPGDCYAVFAYTYRRIYT